MKSILGARRAGARRPRAYPGPAAAAPQMEPVKYLITMTLPSCVPAEPECTCDRVVILEVVSDMVF